MYILVFFVWEWENCWFILMDLFCIFFIGGRELIWVCLFIVLFIYLFGFVFREILCGRVCIDYDKGVVFVLRGDCLCDRCDIVLLSFSRLYC